ncbi:MAG: P-loop NTPase [Bacillota bacterium]
MTSSLVPWESVVAVVSGKGGTGQSAVVAAIALVMQTFGWKVGILEINPTFSSVPFYLGFEGIWPTEKSTPQLINGIHYAAGPTAPGRQFSLAKWVRDQVHSCSFGGQGECLLIDLPPGPSGWLQYLLGLPNSCLLLVTTPHPTSCTALSGVLRQAKDWGSQLLGIVENMSFFTCRHGDKFFPFGQGATDRLAAQNALPVLGHIPLTSRFPSGWQTVPPLALELEQMTLTIMDRLKLAKITSR